MVDDEFGVVVVAVDRKEPPEDAVDFLGGGVLKEDPLVRRRGVATESSEKVGCLEVDLCFTESLLCFDLVRLTPASFAEQSVPPFEVDFLRLTHLDRCFEADFEGEFDAETVEDFIVKRRDIKIMSTFHRNGDNACHAFLFSHTRDTKWIHCINTKIGWMARTPGRTYIDSYITKVDTHKKM